MGQRLGLQKPPRCSKELCTNQIRLLPLGLPAFGGDMKKGSGERGRARARDPRSNFEGQAETRTISKGIGKMAAKLPTIFSSLPKHPPSTKKHKASTRPKILLTRPCTKTNTQKILGQNRAAKKILRKYSGETGEPKKYSENMFQAPLAIHFSGPRSRIANPRSQSLSFLFIVFAFHFHLLVPGVQGLRFLLCSLCFLFHFHIPDLSSQTFPLLFYLILPLLFMLQGLRFRV